MYTTAVIGQCYVHKCSDLTVPQTSISNDLIIYDKQTQYTNEGPGMHRFNNNNKMNRFNNNQNNVTNSVIEQCNLIILYKEPIEQLTH